ncbi:MAG: glycoside hydrolase family 16 protein [Ignavibacteriales bacterium]|nr:glycoside hydrolase family 16 protein [Ignavibacteriales bacterium]
MKCTIILLGGLFILIIVTGCKKNDNGINSVPPSDTIPQLPGWKLVWNDEFNGSSLDLTKWQYEVNGNGGGNHELEYYTAGTSNSYVANGSLVICAKRENYLGKQYTSARINTHGLGDWKYGRFEIRAQLPFGKGLWPAIWMLPTDYVYGRWPKSGEIDIMECLGDNTWKVYGTIHFADSFGNHAQSGGSYSLPIDSASFAGGFHVLAIEWDSTSIQWSVDGNQYYSVNRSTPFDQRFHLVLNVAIGGDWPGSPNEFTTFPQTMIVDYVRVYQRP